MSTANERFNGRGNSSSAEKNTIFFVCVIIQLADGNENQMHTENERKTIEVENYENQYF